MATLVAERPTAFHSAMDLDLDLEEGDNSDNFGGFSENEDEIRMDTEPQNQKEEEEDESDDEEKELEQLLFGVSGNWRREVGKFAVARRKSGEDDEETAEADALDAMKDDQLFFVDTEPSAAADGQLQTVDDSDDPDSRSKEKPAWEDSDDERITVSLASATRLRKLRKTEEEDLVSGKEYIKRLKRQYQKLHPMPEWVLDARKLQQGRKKRRTIDGQEATDSSSDENMEVEDEVTDHQSLADLLRHSGSLVGDSKPTLSKRKLPPEVIDIQRGRQIAAGGPSSVTCLQIHPAIPLLIASGPSSRMDLYHLHDQPPMYSSKITSLWMKCTPFTTTAFHPLISDPRIFLSARRRFFHVWNLGSGQLEKITRIYGQQDEQRTMERFKISPTGGAIAFLGSSRKGGGVLNILDGQTLQWIAQARIESHGGIAEFEWWSNGEGLCVAGKNGEITEWSLVNRRTIARWKDEGAVGTTTIALGGTTKSTESIGGDTWIAIGSSAGIVNIYSRRRWLKEEHAKQNGANAYIPAAPKPVKVLDQLTTPISHLTFSPDGQLLCMASRWKKDALRLVHLPTCSVYRNWPTANTPFGRISAVCWGEIDGSLRLVVGNEAGKINTWDIRE